MTMRDSDFRKYFALRREIVRLRKEAANARRESGSPQTSKTLRRRLAESLAGGGLLIAVVGGGIQVLPNYVDFGVSACADAHAAIRDDKLNEDIPKRRREIYMLRQIVKAAECDRIAKR